MADCVDRRGCCPVSLVYFKAAQRSELVTRSKHLAKVRKPISPYVWTTLANPKLPESAPQKFLFLVRLLFRRMLQVFKSLGRNVINFTGFKQKRLPVRPAGRSLSVAVIPLTLSRNLSTHDSSFIKKRSTKFFRGWKGADID